MKDHVSVDPSLYDGADGKLTMAVLELIDYEKEHLPLTTKNVDVFETGTARYFDKIEKMFQKYWECLTPRERETIGTSVAKMIDRITNGTKAMIREIRKQQRLTRGR